jgi:polyphenol oxidase
MVIIPKIFDHSKIIAAQSTRLGGVSSAPFESLNLGLSVNDDENNVLKNRQLFFEELRIDSSRLAKSHQVHGSNIFIVDEPGNIEGYDAQITNKHNVFIVISIADCTPILIHDERNNVVAGIHAGWRGTAAKIAKKTMQKMKEYYGTEGQDCKAYIGTCISFENFEVGEEVAAHFDANVKRFDSSKQKWFVDLKSENEVQLLESGLINSAIEISPFCTVTNNDVFFSHRKEKGKTGRMMAVIGMK